MGLAATQARLLSLTQRQHAVEYAAQRVEAQKLQLANETVWLNLNQIVELFDRDKSVISRLIYLQSSEPEYLS